VLIPFINQGSEIRFRLYFPSPLSFTRLLVKGDEICPKRIKLGSTRQNYSGSLSPEACDL
jgi:hypothetical protein